MAEGMFDKDPKEMERNINKESIFEQMESGTISPQEGQDLLIDLQLSDDMYGLDPVDAERALDTGKITPDQANSYLERRESPVWWYIKDIGWRGIVGGSKKFFESAGNAAVDLANTQLGKGIMVGMGVPLPVARDLKLEKADLTPVLGEIDNPESVAGMITGTVTQFGWGFIPAGKVASAFNWGHKALKAGMIARAVAASPKVAKLVPFFEGLINNGMAGAMADYVTFDPFEGRFTDVMKDVGVLPEFLEFMTTDETNPSALERLKNVVEGAGLGIATDFLMLGAKMLHKLARSKLGTGAAEKMLEDIMSNDELAKAISSIDEAKPGRTKVDVDATKTKAPKVTVTEKEANAALRSFVNGISPMDETLVRKLEDMPDARDITNAIFNSVDMGKKVMTHGEGSRQATNMLNKVGKEMGHKPDAVRNALEQSVGGLKNMTVKLEAYSRFVHSHSDQVAKNVNAYLKEGGGSMEELVRLRYQIQQSAELQRALVGYRSEAGRLLNSLKKKGKPAKFTVKAENMSQPELAEQSMADFVNMNRDEMEATLRKFAATDKAGRLKIARILGRGRWGQKILSHVQSSLLWSPKTHIMNMMSQTGATFNMSLNRSIARLVLAGRSLDGRQVKALIKEHGAALKSLQESFILPVTKEGRAASKAWKKAHPEVAKMSFAQRIKANPEVGNAWKAFITREGVIDPTIKVADQDIGQVSKLFGDSWIGKIPSTASAIFKLPFNLLAGVDEAFKALGTKFQYMGLAYDRGIELGLTGTALDDYVNKLNRELDPGMLNDAIRMGKEITFQDDLTGGMLKINQAFNSSTGWLIAKTLFTPFFKTAVNLVSYAGRNSLMAPVFKTSRDALLGRAGKVAQIEAVSRIALGSAAMAYMWQLMEGGQVTGRAPFDQKQAWRDAKVGEYSYKNSKGEWVSYKRTEPFGLLLGLSADLHTAYDMSHQVGQEEFETEYQDVAGAVLMAFLDPVVSSTWMKGVGEMMDIVNNPERKGSTIEKIATRKLETTIPLTTGIDWYHTTFGDDKLIRECTRIQDLIWKKLKTKKLLPRRDPIYGEVIERESPLFGMMNKMTETDDPVKMEMYRIGLQQREQRDVIQVTRNGITAQYKMTPEELNNLEELLSTLPVKEELTKLINTPEYKRSNSDQMKKKVMRKILSQARKTAKDMWLSGSPEAQEALREKWIKESEAIMGRATARDATTALYHWTTSLGFTE